MLRTAFNDAKDHLPKQKKQDFVSLKFMSCVAIVMWHKNMKLFLRTLTNSMFSCTVAASQVKYPLNVIALFPTQNCAAIKPKSFVES